MIEILMATYQGEKYIESQIQSILSQTYNQWKLLIRDDQSTDMTVMIIKKYKKKYPDKIFLISDNKCCGSSKANFFQLINYANAEYIMLCDQDDVWYPEKIQVMINSMQQNEKKDLLNHPILVTSGLKVVDEQLRPIKNIKMSVSEDRLKLNYILVQNEIPGCTIMCNKALYKGIGHPLIKKIIMHDWWLTMYACVFGNIIVIPDQLMLYRQHNNNVSGAVDTKSLHYAYLKFKDSHIRKAYKDMWCQAECFYKEYKNTLNDSSLNEFQKFCSLKYKNKFMKILLSLKYKYLKTGLLRILGQFIYI